MGVTGPPGSSLQDGAPSNPVGVARERGIVESAVKEAIQGNTPQPASSGVTGDFPPYYGGTTFDQWRKRQKLLSEREYERLQKLTPKEQDDEHAERKRRQEEWQKMKVPEKEPPKQ